MESPLLPFDPGQMPGQSTTLLPQEDPGSIILTPSSRNLVSENVQILMDLGRSISTEESALQNNVKIYDVRSQNSRKRTLSTESSQISDQGSILRDPDFEPFWTNSTKEWSQKLWSCTETDLQDSPVTYWNSSSNKKDANSWFTVEAKAPRSLHNLPRTSWLSQQSLWRLIMENEQRKTEGNARKEQVKKKRKLARSKAKKVYKYPRTRKVRVFPAASERKTIKEWFGVTRRAYNIAVDIKNKINEKDPNVLEKLKELTNEVKRDKLGRPVIKSKHGKIYYLTRGCKDAQKLLVRRMEREGNLNFVKSVPQAVRDSGILDFFKAVAAGEAKNEEKENRGEEKIIEKFKFRSRKNTTQTLELNARDWNRLGKSAKLFKTLRTKKECLPSTAACAVRVQMDKTGRIFLCFVREFEIKSESQAPDQEGNYHSTVALDPGVKTFQTLFDADGQAIEWGKNDMTEIFVLCRHIDGIQSKISKKGPTYTLRRAYHRAIRKVKDKIKECHRKLALFLCENYRVIIIPPFETKNMIKKAERKIRKKTVRQMCTWSHYSFRQALFSKAELHPWVKVIEYGEHHTTKTCDLCGTLNHNVGGRKTFKCVDSICGHVADRDIHAAKNILLRYLTRESIKIPERLGFPNLCGLAPP